ncbi:alpha/beta fold hydrolase [Mucilaginibacter sp. JRF]|uniref:alpha/beta hydrolase n=1 Tax=Mucilaginibacter sp. JRF TaxID=2780088 RepID=UPI00187EFB3C|nr:alpha/beta fold hydrolase [Mucilaginibacter sp. JRF]MBE9582940.1 alpha/beta fold hydrolase [Mucilaginibacter sp. JRF]
MTAFKTLVTAVILTLTTINLFAQAEPEANKKAVQYFIKQYNTGHPDSVYTRFSTEMKAALPADQFRTTTIQLKNQLGMLKNADFLKLEGNVSVYKANFEKATFTLNVAVNAQNQYIGLLLRPYEATPGEAAASTAAIDASLTETPYTLKTFSGNISGSLVKPKGEGKVPLVLIIAGSGPTDRNGNSAKLGLNTNAYMQLANELGKKGIATLRYDKRLIGQSTSTTKESELKFEDMVEDAVGLINDVNDKGEFSKIIVLGHSEGSLVGMLASAEAPVKGFISVAGAGDPAEKILSEQMKTQPKYIADGFKRVLDSLKRGKTTPDVDASLYFIARPSIQGYIMSWCRYDPQREIKKLKMPVLILQGTTDLQVPTAQAEKLKKGKSDAQLTIIPEMNHVLKAAPADTKQNMATYNAPELPLKPELVTGIVDFVGKVK